MAILVQVKTDNAPVYIYSEMKQFFLQITTQRLKGYA